MTSGWRRCIRGKLLRRPCRAWSGRADADDFVGMFTIHLQRSCPSNAARTLKPICSSIGFPTAETVSSSSTTKTVPLPRQPFPQSLPSSEPQSRYRTIHSGARTLKSCLFRLRSRIQRTLVAAHDAEGSGHAQPAPRELCSEERIEDLFYGLGVHTTARVSHFEKSINAFGQRFVQAGSQGIIDIIEMCGHNASRR